MKRKLLIVLAVVMLIIAMFFIFGCHKRIYARALIRAVENYDQQKLEELLQLDGDISVKPYIEPFALWAERFNYPPLLLACERGNVDAVSTLLQYGADPNQMCDGRTPLIIACYSYSKNRNEIIMLLLAAGSDTSYIDPFGNRPYDYYLMTGGNEATEIAARLK